MNFIRFTRAVDGISVLVNLSFVALVRPAKEGRHAYVLFGHRILDPIEVVESFESLEKMLMGADPIHQETNAPSLHG